MMQAFVVRYRYGRADGGGIVPTFSCPCAHSVPEYVVQSAEVAVRSVRTRYSLQGLQT